MDLSTVGGFNGVGAGVGWCQLAGSSKGKWRFEGHGRYEARIFTPATLGRMRPRL